MRWLFLVSFLYAGSVFAGGGCGPVNLQREIGPPMDQGYSGYCFAHASSSLIQAKIGERVSPMQLATAYILTNPEDLNGAVDSEVKKRLTPEFFSLWHSDRIADPENYGPTEILGMNGLINVGGDELQTLEIANFVGLCNESRLPTGEFVYKKYLKMISEFHAQRLHQGISPEERMRPIGEVVDPDSRVKAWSYRLWVEKRCGSYFMPKVPLLPLEVSVAPSLRAFRKLQRLRAVAEISLDQNKVVQAIHEQLDRGNVVSIGYALSDIMPEEKHLLAKALVSSDPSVEDHASVIAGRREVNGKCYFYLRNSFGYDKEGYLPKIKARYENGGVWVLPEELPSLYSAVWLE